MRVKTKMLDRQLRFVGGAARFLHPYFTARQFPFCNSLLRTFYKGRAFTKKISYEQKLIPCEHGELRLCIYRPKSERVRGAGVLWLHGGGYAMGIPEQDAKQIESIVLALGCTVVAPDYTLSTKAPFPAALDDAYRALEWLFENADEYAVCRDKIIVGGASAGGGLTVALCMLARDRGGPKISFALPLYPMLDDTMSTPSALENNAPVWSTKSSEAAWRLYLAENYGGDDVSKYAAPTRETDYGGLPPMLTFAGDVEPFFDEINAFVEGLRRDGVRVEYTVFKGCFHAFDTLKKPACSRRARALVLDGLRRAAGA